MEHVIENLGRLAAQCELQAAKTSLPAYAKIKLTDLATRYREAQYEEIQKGAGND